LWRANRPNGTSDVLSELEHILGALSPGLADTTLADLSDDEVHRLLTEAAQGLKSQRPATASTNGAKAPRTDAAFQRALEALAAALGGPKTDRYRLASSNRPDVVYDLTVESGGDVTCSCPGFEYRGPCSHSRALKTVLAKGAAVPDEYRRVA
jgi:SWIM zinc finger